jgi:hypothetical protein
MATGKWTVWDYVAYTGVYIGAAILAVEAWLQNAPRLRAQVTGIVDGWLWGITPILLLSASGAIWLAQRFGWIKAPASTRSAEPHDSAAPPAKGATGKWMEVEIDGRRARARPVPAQRVETFARIHFSGDDRPSLLPTLGESANLAGWTTLFQDWLLRVKVDKTTGLFTEKEMRRAWTVVLVWRVPVASQQLDVTAVGASPPRFDIRYSAQTFAVIYFPDGVTTATTLEFRHTLSQSVPHRLH